MSKADAWKCLKRAVRRSEVLCDECESALNFEEFEDTLRKEVLLTIGAR
jgi:hypothetical protein